MDSIQQKPDLSQLVGLSDGQRITGVRWKRKAGGALEVTYTHPGDVGPVSSLSTVLFDALEQPEFWRWLAHVRE